MIAFHVANSNKFKKILSETTITIMNLFQNDGSLKRNINISKNIRKYNHGSSGIEVKKDAQKLIMSQISGKNLQTNAQKLKSRKRGQVVFKTMKKLSLRKAPKK